jgi:hypothetical protein
MPHLEKKYDFKSNYRKLIIWNSIFKKLQFENTEKSYSTSQ